MRPRTALRLFRGPPQSTHRETAFLRECTRSLKWVRISSRTDWSSAGREAPPTFLAASDNPSHTRISRETEKSEENPIDFPGPIFALNGDVPPRKRFLAPHSRQSRLSLSGSIPPVSWRPTFALCHAGCLKFAIDAPIIRCQETDSTHCRPRSEEPAPWRRRSIVASTDLLCPSSYLGARPAFRIRVIGPGPHEVQGVPHPSSSWPDGPAPDVWPYDGVYTTLVVGARREILDSGPEEIDADSPSSPYHGAGDLGITVDTGRGRRPVGTGSMTGWGTDGFDVHLLPGWIPADRVDSRHDLAGEADAIL